MGTPQKAPALAVAIPVEDVVKPGTTSSTVASTNITELSSPPFKYTRIGLYVAAILLAIPILIAQSILMNTKYKGSYFDYYYLWYGSYVSTGSTYTTFTIKGENAAKAPNLVIATAVLALVLAILLLVFVSIPAVSLTLGAAIAEVALVPIVVVLLLASIGVSGKTASTFKGSGWPKGWVGGNGAALAFEILSLFVWIALLVLASIALIRVLNARKAAPPKPAPAVGLPAHPV